MQRAMAHLAAAVPRRVVPHIGRAMLRAPPPEAVAAGQAAQARLVSIAEMLHAASRRATSAGGRGCRLVPMAPMGLERGAGRWHEAPWPQAQQRHSMEGRRGVAAQQEARFAKPTLMEPGRCWIYSPAALDKAPVEPRRRAGVVRFQMWKVDGLLHVHGACAATTLVLPVYTSDGVGYPALSSVLRTWKDARNKRWGLFRQYMAFALEFADGSLQASEAEFPNFQMSDEGKRLDKRFGQARCQKDWLYICDPDEQSTPSL